MASTQHPIGQKYDKLFKAILGEGYRLMHDATKAPYDEKLDVGKYTLYQVGSPMVPVASFELYPMINCCGICVSTKAEVRTNFQNKGLGTLLNSLRIDIARECGYGVLLCTDIESNTYQRNILKRNGWTDLLKFVNPRTKNVVYVSAINL